MELKEQIKIARNALGISQEEFASRMGVSKQAVLFWELGKGPKLSRVKEIEDVLKTKFNVTGHEDNKTFTGTFQAEHMAMAQKLSMLPKATQDAISVIIDMATELVHKSATQKRSIKPFTEHHGKSDNRIESFFEMNHEESIENVVIGNTKIKSKK